MQRVTILLIVMSLFGASAPVAVAQDNRVSQLLSSAQKALETQDTVAALRFTNDALAIAPKNMDVLVFRSQVHEAAHDYAAALADLDEVLTTAPKWVAAYNARGQVRFKAGDFAGSVADFDKYLELRPQAAPAHWQRGISLYYAGEYAKGRDQFIAYQDVNNADVENSVWQYLCNAKVVGNEQARKEFPATGNDSRVPLMKVYDLFVGKGTVDDVVKAAKTPGIKREEAIRRDFYMNLYLGLYYVSEDQPEKALEHLKLAANPVHEFTEYNYMWHVARVHAKLLEDAQAAKDKPAAPKSE